MEGMDMKGTTAKRRTLRTESERGVGGFARRRCFPDPMTRVLVPMPACWRTRDLARIVDEYDEETLQLWLQEDPSITQHVVMGIAGTALDDDAGPICARASTMISNLSGSTCELMHDVFLRCTIHLLAQDTDKADLELDRIMSEFRAGGPVAERAAYMAWSQLCDTTRSRLVRVIGEAHDGALESRDMTVHIVGGLGMVLGSSIRRDARASMALPDLIQIMSSDDFTAESSRDILERVMGVCTRCRAALSAMAVGSLLDMDPFAGMDLTERICIQAMYSRSPHAFFVTNALSVSNTLELMLDM